MSLQEQRDAISRYADRNSLEIVSWFEEQETAAKRGRPVFNQMLKLLRHRKAEGLVLHKIDRGARNLKDWADLVEISDQGIDVHLANESLDIRSRGGRLSADIQAVVAADYIRNLREETRKGFYGRLKQGLYPLPAPLGYVDKGQGRVKEPDPLSAMLVRKTFELYASGRYSLELLGQELFRLGLRNKRGGKVTRTGLSVLLNNPFYFGLIRLRRTRETFSGNHPPLISKALFDRVQAILASKDNTKIQRHDFLFRRLLRCKQCGYSLIGEKQKGHHYYRCHSPTCSTTGLREESVAEQVQEQLAPLLFDDEERNWFASRIAQLKSDWGQKGKDERKTLNLRIGQTKDRLNRLTDAFLDGAIDRQTFDERKSALLFEQKGLEESLQLLTTEKSQTPDRLAEFLELAGSAWLSYKMGIFEEKRDLLKIVTSNRDVSEKNVELRLSFPFCEVAKRFKNTNGPPYRDKPRTLDELIAKIIDWLRRNPTPTWMVGKSAGRDTA